MQYIVLFVSSVALFAFWTLLGGLYRARVKRRKMKVRGHLSLETFIKEFDGAPYRRKAIEATYDDIAGWCDYPIRRWDEFDEMGIGEDGDDLLRMRCSKLGVPDVFNSSYADRFPLLTVDDYVRFLSDVMEQEHNNEAGATDPV